MSKPGSNSDVEDVLSSIRRLVGDKKTPEMQHSAGAGQDKLVLSPQQRVPGTDVLRLSPSDAVVLPKPSPPEQAAAAKPAKGHPDAPSQDKQSGAGQSPKLDDLSATIAALETEIAQTADQWEPDGLGRDDYAGTPSSGMAWPARAELDGTGAPVDASAAGIDCEEAVDATVEQRVEDATEDHILDEAALRELVSEIVRDELQGILGERITRNVRKLVRREVQRALAARAMD